MLVRICTTVYEIVLLLLSCDSCVIDWFDLVWPFSPPFSTMLWVTITLCTGGGVGDRISLNLPPQVAGEAHVCLSWHGDDMWSNITGIYWRLPPGLYWYSIHRRVKHVTAPNMPIMLCYLGLCIFIMWMDQHISYHCFYIRYWDK